MIKLSIIIPYWNTEKYVGELLDVLEKQINDQVEVILVDDGSTKPFESKYNWLQVYRKENGGCASARNYGLERASGEYVQFIDSDDLVPDYFIETLLQAFENKPDVIEHSWKSLSQEGTQHDHLLKNEDDVLCNPSVCTRCFKRSFIGPVRFNEQKDSTEDEDFTRKLGVRDPENKYKHLAITKYMYFYRTAVTNSKIKRFKKGLMKTRRIVYYYKHVTSDMTWLLEDIKEEDKTNEVWLITEQNDIPELKRYCQISRPIKIWGHELRGEAYDKFELAKVAIRKQIVIYVEFANVVGGITTFIYNWSHLMSKRHDILILYDKIDQIQVDKLSMAAPTMKNDIGVEIICDTIILNRLTDKIPPNVTYNKSIQICHACVQKNYRIPKDRDYLINVSKAAKDSWGDESKEGIVIHNPFYREANELFLVSATRMQAVDKGDNDKRFRILANKLNEAGIPFVWLNFSDKSMPNPPRNFINMEARLNIQSFIKRADYLVQLSNVEAYSMSILEALSLRTCVLACPFPSLFEEGFEDGVTGYIVPFDMEFDVKKLLKVPSFDHLNDNHIILNQWEEILSLPASATRREDRKVRVNVVRGFCDKHTGKHISRGIISLPLARVNEIKRVEQEKNVQLIQVIG